MFTVMQNAIGETHERMLRMTEAHHYAWARRHGWVYEAHYGRQFVGDWHPYWEKPRLIVDWMRRNPRGAKLVMIDTDALVLRPWFSPGALLPLWANVAFSWVKDLHRINFGVSAMENQPETEAFFQKVIDKGEYPGRANSYDEGRIMFELGVGDKAAPAEPFEKDGLRIHWLPPEFNRYPHNRADAPTVIRAWHGVFPKENAMVEMQAEMEVIARNGYRDPNAA